VELTGLKELQQNHEALISARLTDKLHRPVEGATVAISLLRPATAQDDQKSILMKAVGYGAYKAAIRLQDPGLWVAVVDVSQGQDKYQIQQNIVVPKAE